MPSGSARGRAAFAGRRRASPRGRRRARRAGRVGAARTPAAVTSRSRRRAAPRRPTRPKRRSPGWAGAASRTLSSTVIRVSDRAVWNVRPRPARTIRCGGRRSMRSPASSMRPSSGRRKPEMQWKSVDFPAPLGPMSAVIEPASTTRDARSTARTPANALLTPLASSSALIRAPSRRGGRAVPGAGRGRVR